jgi:hypothetical protein
LETADFWGLRFLEKSNDLNRTRPGRQHEVRPEEPVCDFPTGRVAIPLRMRVADREDSLPAS